MPNTIPRSDSIQSLANELLRRQLADDPEQFRQQVQSTSPSGMAISPGLLQTLGGLADAASTYAFLKRGDSTEANPLVGFTRNRAAATGVAALTGLAATKGATALIGMRFPRVADAIASNLGAEQLGLAVDNLRGLDARNGRSSYRTYNDALQRSVIREAGKR